MPEKDISPWTPSRHRLESLLRGSPPYPMVSLPPEGGFWLDPPQDHQNSFDSEASHLEELEESPCHTYRAHFLQSEHFNFCGLDEVMGPVVLSIKYCCDSDSSTSNHIHFILRLTTGTRHHLLDSSSSSTVLQLTHSLCPSLSLTHLQPILCPSIAQLLLKFDE